jgi:hypothetical protein
MNRNQPTTLQSSRKTTTCVQVNASGLIIASKKSRTVARSEFKLKLKDKWQYSPLENSENSFMAMTDQCSQQRVSNMVTCTHLQAEFGSEPHETTLALLAENLLG